MQGWDKERGFLPPAGGKPHADLYACGDRERLYLGVLASEYVDLSLYPGKTLPEPDARH